MSQEASPQQHIRIARYAVSVGWLSWEQAMRWLMEVGHERAARGDSPLEVWVVRGLLTEEQLDEALESGEPISTPSSSYRHVTSRVSPATPIAAHHMVARARHTTPQESYETLMTLPTAVMLQQHRASAERLHAPVQSELGALSSDPLQSLANTTLPPRVTLSALDSEQTDAFERPRLSPEELDALDLPEADDAPTHDEPPAMLSTGQHVALQLQENNDPFTERYMVGEELGQGGCGRVVRAFDRVLGRYVAMKLLKPDVSRRAEQLTRFISEAQTTGQLEHPNIVPIYDFGTLASGEVYYTMREVRNTSLRRVLKRLKRADEEAEDEYTLPRLIGILRQVCLAIHYAHVRGVIHRDMKPDNIMLGDYGEVLVMDWGLARLFDELPARERSMRSEGQTLGTPAYMPPEQARGELALVDEVSDVYSLGAILYELLTLEPPYYGESPIDVMWHVVEGELIPPSKRNHARHVPDELERICMRALAHRKEVRFASAKDLHDALNDWSEGLQPREAARRTTDGEAWGRRYRMLLKEGDALELRVRREAAKIEPFEPVERKRPLWTLEDRLRRFHLESARAFGHAVANFTQALAYLPGHLPARSGLADLYWARLEQAERQHDVVNAIYFKALVAQFDDEDHYQHLLKDSVSLRVTTSPHGARLSLRELREEDRRLIPTHDFSLNLSAGQQVDLPTGRYMLSATLPERPTVHLPLHCERGSSHNIHLHLPDATHWRPGFAFIPAGPMIAGGDPEAFDPIPIERCDIPSFFCATFPVTFREYLAWVDDLQIHDPEQARLRAPQLRGSEGFLVNVDPATGRWTPDPILIEGTARERYPIDGGHEWSLPVVGVRAEDADAYAVWLSQRHQVPYRLPDELEWEKTGRGADGRLFPWGDHFDATFCKMRSSRREISQLEPVGAFPHDTSPYGVRDLAGGVMEWCARDEHATLDRAVRGGSWSQDMRSCRLASRSRLLAAARTGALGFRLVYSLPQL